MATKWEPVERDAVVFVGLLFGLVLLSAFVRPVFFEDLFGPFFEWLGPNNIWFFVVELLRIIIFDFGLLLLTVVVFYFGSVVYSRSKKPAVKESVKKK